MSLRDTMQLPRSDEGGNTSESGFILNELWIVCCYIMLNSMISKYSRMEHHGREWSIMTGNVYYI